MRVRPLALSLGLALFAPRAQAAEEYRSFTLTDGRQFVAEVLETQTTGMRVRTPQGETVVPFEALADMVPVDAKAFTAQGDLYVFVAASTVYRSGFEAAFKTLDKVRVLGPSEPGGVLSPEEQAAAATCDLDLECLVDALGDNEQWMWIVVGQMDSAEAVFRGAVSTGSEWTRASAPRVDFDAVNVAAWKAIGIDVPEPVEVAVEIEEPPGPAPKVPRERKPLTRKRVDALSFVPIPGYPSLAGGDPGGFGIAMATVVPATALWVGATGKVAQSPGGQVALAVGGYYAATVVANNVLGTRTLRRNGGGMAVGVAPTEQGGASVQVTLVK